MRLLLQICLFTLLFSLEGCNDSNIIDYSGVNYSVDLQIVKSGYNEKWCWYHPRAAKCGNDKDIVLLMQPWITSHSDYYQFLNMMKTTNGGKTWSEPISFEDSLGEQCVDDAMVRICDVTPQ